MPRLDELKKGDHVQYQKAHMVDARTGKVLSVQYSTVKVLDIDGHTVQVLWWTSAWIRKWHKKSKAWIVPARPHPPEIDYDD